MDFVKIQKKTDSAVGVIFITEVLISNNLVASSYTVNSRKNT